MYHGSYVVSSVALLYTLSTLKKQNHRVEGVASGCMYNRHPRNGSDVVRAVAFSPDGSQLASGSDDYSVKLWSAETGECLKTLAGHS